MLVARASATTPAVDGYADDAEFGERLEALAATDVATLASLGTTLGGREIQLVTLAANAAAEEADQRPAVLVIGSVRASNLVGSELALRIAEQLAAQAASDAAVAALLNAQTIYVVPRPNPDASAAAFHPPYTGRNVNVRPTDDDRDGRINEDPPNDLDGDGWITNMRVRSSKGTYMPHPTNADVLIKADPAKDEVGVFELFSEGVDDDDDESFNEDGPGGVDFDRNFTFGYDYFSAGAGPHQVSEVETRAIADFSFKHPNIYAVFVFSPYDNLVEPWKSKSDKGRIVTSVLADDVPFFKHVGKLYQEAVKPAKPAAAGEPQGDFLHWAYFHFGRWSFGTPGWSIPEKVATAGTEADAEDSSDQQDESAGNDRTGDASRPPGSGAGNESEDRSEAAESGAEEPDEAAPEEPEPEAAKQEAVESAAPDKGVDQGDPKTASPSDSQDDKQRGRDDLRALAWFAQQGIDGFAAWTRVEHPDFPGQEVEVGGFRPYLRDHPPASELDSLATRHREFIVELLELKPHLALEVREIDSRGGGIYLLKVAARNTGYLPTESAMGGKSLLLPKVMLTLELPAGVRLVNGRLRQGLPALAGRGGEREVTWLVAVETAAKSRILGISARSAPVGSVDIEVELPE